MICTEVAYERKRNYNKIDNSWRNIYDYLLNCSPYVHECEILDWRKLLLFVGIPFGIQKMFLLVVPRNVGTGEMLGLLVFNLMVGSLIGIGVFFFLLLAVADILLKNSISGIIWIIKRLKEMVIKNERKATGKIVL